MMLMSNIVLHIDDDEDDLAVFADALTSHNKEIEIKQEQDAEKALRFLQSSDVLPGMIIVDLNMPILSGKELLPIIKNDPRLQHIPIFAFTTSSLQSDKDYCKCFGVECITKPLLFEDLVKTASYMLNNRKSPD